MRHAWLSFAFSIFVTNYKLLWNIYVALVTLSFSFYCSIKEKSKRALSRWRGRSKVYMQPINSLIPLKRALGNGKKTRNRQKMTRFSYILQDYDLKKLAMNEWVAVAYKEGFYIGKVEKFLRTRLDQLSVRRWSRRSHLASRFRQTRH